MSVQEIDTFSTMSPNEYQSGAFLDSGRSTGYVITITFHVQIRVVSQIIKNERANLKRLSF